MWIRNCNYLTSYIKVNVSETKIFLRQKASKAGNKLLNMSM